MNKLDYNQLRYINPYIRGYYHYGIYDDGRVYSVKRDKFISPYLMNGTNRGNYLRLNLYLNRKIERGMIHRLVAEVFLYNDDPINKTQVNHKDLNKLNNHKDNLEGVSPSNNIKHARKTKNGNGLQNHNGEFGYSTKTSKKCRVGNKEFNSLSGALRYLGIPMCGYNTKKLIKNGTIILI